MAETVGINGRLYELAVSLPALDDCRPSARGESSALGRILQRLERILANRQAVLDVRQHAALA